MLISHNSTKVPVKDSPNLNPKKAKFYILIKRIAQVSTAILVLSIYPGLVFSEVAPTLWVIVAGVSFLLTFAGWIVYTTR